MVPEGWKLTSLNEVCDGNLQTGPFGSQLHAHEYENDGVPVLMPRDLINCRADLNSAAKISMERAIPLKKHILRKGDIVFSRRGDVARFALIDEKSEGSICGTGCLKARPSVNHSPEFLAYFLQKDAVKKWLEQNAVGQTMPNMNTEILSELPLMSASSLNEEIKIAAILSTWDKSITTTEQLLANSLQQKKALMQQLLTGKKRLLDENGERFRGEWKEGKLSEIANVDTGYAFKSTDFTDSEKGIPIIRMSDFKAGGIDISGAAKVIPESTIGLDRFKLKTGDFVFGMSGSLSNYGWVKEQDLPCFLNQRVGRILAKECAVQLFVTYLYLSDKIQKSILDKAAGAAQLNISSTDLRNTIVNYPSVEEQQKIASVLTAADEEISALKRKIEALKQEKKALMQQLLTGKRRVKVDEVAA